MPRKVADLIDVALSRAPDERFGSCVEFSEALELAFDGKRWAKRPAFRWIGTALVSVLLGGGLWTGRDMLRGGDRVGASRSTESGESNVGGSEKDTAAVGSVSLSGDDEVDRSGDRLSGPAESSVSDKEEPGASVTKNVGVSPSELSGSQPNSVVMNLAAGDLIRELWSGRPPHLSEVVNQSPRIEFTLEARRPKDPPGHYRPIPDGTILRSRIDRYRIRITPRTEGYLYVYQVDSAGNVAPFFPRHSFSSYSAGENPVKPDQEITLPTRVEGKTDEAFVLDDHVGIEHFYVAFCVGPWDALDERVERSRGKHKGVTVDKPIGLRSRGVGGKVSEEDNLNDPNHAIIVGEKEYLVLERWIRHIRD